MFNVQSVIHYNTRYRSIYIYILHSTRCIQALCAITLFIALFYLCQVAHVVCVQLVWLSAHKGIHKRTHVTLHIKRDKDPKDAFKPDLNVNFIRQVWDVIFSIWKLQSLVT